MATEQNFVGLPQPGQTATVLPTQTGISQGTSSSWQTAATKLNATPQSELSLAIAQAAEGLGNQFYQWANKQLPADTAVTGQSVGNYFNASQKMFGAANTFMNQYNNTYAPEMQQLANTAGEYSSNARRQFNAGQAIAGTLQGTNAAKAQGLQALQEYGINPNSGVYQELQQSNNTLAGGEAGAAGTTAAMNTEAAGRQLLGQSVGVGETLPGAAVNAANTGIAATSGAENAQLANTTTGTTALQAPNSYFQTAQNLTPEQTTSTSSGGGTSQQTSENQGFNYPASVHTLYQGGVAKGGAIPAIPEYAGGGAAAHLKVMQPKNFANAGRMRGTGIGGISMGKGHPSMHGGGGRGQGQPPMNAAGGQRQNPVAPSTGTVHDIGYPTMHDIPNSASPGSPSGGGMPMPGGAPGGGQPGAIPATPDMSGDGGPDVGRGGAMPGALMNQAMMMHKQQRMAGGGATAQDSAIPDNGAPTGGIDGSQAVGGPSTGGFVSHALSPSRGQQTDDVPARLNAGEFVIPRDVAAWKGQEFFQKMIQQSRMALQTAQAMPTMGGQ